MKKILLSIVLSMVVCLAFSGVVLADQVIPVGENEAYTSYRTPLLSLNRMAEMSFCNS